MQRAALARSLADPNGEWAEHVAARCPAGLHSVADAGLVSALRRGNSGGLGSGALTGSALATGARGLGSPATLLQGVSNRAYAGCVACPIRPSALLLLSGSLLVGGLHHQQMARQNESRIAGLSQRLLHARPRRRLRNRRRKRRCGVCKTP